MAQLSLKGVIAKLLANSLQIKGAKWQGGCTGNLTDSRVWHKYTDFSGYSQSNTIPDTSYFTATSDGIQVKKAGYYFCYAFAHVNTNVANTQVAIQLYNLTTGAALSTTGYYATSTSWIGCSIANLANVGANQVIGIRTQKYTDNTTTTYRPTVAVLVVLKIV